MTGIPTLQSIRKLSEKHPAFSEPSLRWIIFNADKNGFANAIYRLGRRVYIDEEAFFRILKEQGQSQ
jgi:hypothetical protein